MKRLFYLTKYTGLSSSKKTNFSGVSFSEKNWSGIDGLITWNIYFASKLLKDIFLPKFTYLFIVYLFLFGQYIM